MPTSSSLPDTVGWVLVTIGVTCVVAGGMVAAVTTPLDLVHGSWLAAYLVLVGGVGQCVMGMTRLFAPGHPNAAVLGWTQVSAWNLGNALVITGTLETLPFVVDLGGLACVVGLAIALLNSRRPGRSLPTRAFRAVLAVLTVSIPIGLVLAHLRASS